MKLVLACFLILTTAASGQAAPRHILVRDFRTVKDGQVVSFNIGTAAHAARKGLALVIEVRPV